MEIYNLYYLRLEHPWQSGYHVWLEKVDATVNVLHSAGVVHADLFPCNSMSKWEADVCTDLKLIDFEASLLLTDIVPETASTRIINSKGFVPMYHPDFLQPNSASEEFDFWFLAAFRLQLEDATGTVQTLSEQ